MRKENTKTIFVFRKEEASEIPRYCEKYIAPFTNELLYTVTASDRQYNKLSKANYSTIHIFKDNKEIFSCPLKEFGMRWPSAATRMNEESLPNEWKHLDLPKYFRVYSTPSSVYLFDERFEDLYFLDKSSNKLKRLSTTKAEANYQLDIFFAHYPERKRLHDSLLPLAQKPMQFKETGIGSVGTYKDTLLVINKVNYLDTTMYKAMTIPIWRKCLFITAYYKDSVLYRKVIDRPYFRYYWIDETSGISADDSFYYISINAKAIGNKNAMVAKWERNSGNFARFADGIKLSLPSYYVSSHLDYDFFELIFSQPYFMVPLSNNLYSVHESDSTALPIKMDSNDLSKINDDIAIFGMYVLSLEHKGSVIHVLYRDAKVFRFARYDLEAKNLLQDGPIPGLTTKNMQIHPSFDGPDHIIYSKPGCKCLIEPLCP